MENTEKMETNEVEMNQRMLERLDSIDNATYCYLMQLLELSVDGAEDKFPWDIMEKERLISSIEDAVAQTGMKIMDENKDSIIVRGKSIDTDFEIRVSQLAG